MDGGTARHGQTVLFKRQPHVVSSSTFVPSGSPPAFFRQAAAPEGGGLSFETGCSKARARASSMSFLDMFVLLVEEYQYDIP